MKYILTFAALAVSLSAHAVKAPDEQWQVKATFSYVNDAAKTVSDVPAMSFTVPINQCEKGASRATKESGVESSHTQEACVAERTEKDKSRRTVIKGWLMPAELVPNVMTVKGERLNASGLDQGRPFEIITDGGYVRAIVGEYIVEISRVASEKRAAAAKPAVKGGVDGKKLAHGGSIKEGGKIKEGKKVNPADKVGDVNENAFSIKTIR